ELTLVTRRAMRIALLRFVEELAADQHPTYLGCTCANFIQLGVAPQPAGWIFVDIAVAAQTLDRFARHPRRLFRGVQNRTRGILACRFTAIACLTDCVNVRTTSVLRRIHVGDLALNQLEL